MRYDRNGYEIGPGPHTSFAFACSAHLIQAKVCGGRFLKKPKVVLDFVNRAGPFSKWVIGFRCFLLLEPFTVVVGFC